MQIQILGLVLPQIQILRLVLLPSSSRSERPCGDKTSGLLPNRILGLVLPLLRQLEAEILPRRVTIDELVVQ